MTNETKLPWKLIEQSEPFNINSNVLPKDAEYTISVFSFKKLTIQKGIWSIIKGILGLDTQEAVYRVVLYLNDTVVAEMDVDPDAWGEIRGRTIERLVNYAETHYNNTFAATDNLKNTVKEFKNECEYLKETK